MGMHGAEIYDDDAVFAAYMAMRQGPDTPNDTLEWPVLLELVGELAGRRILDLGCGDATFGRHALDHGCRAYVGVEGSRNMVAAARQALTGTPGEVVHAPIETWAYPAAAFDLVVSRLALHYIADVAATFARVYHTLAAGGHFVCSVEHPVITSCDRGRRVEGRQDWVVDDYFDLGPRVTSWFGGRVVKYHRTVEAYFTALQGAGLIVESLRESHPRRAMFADEATYKRRKRTPLFLFLAARKPEQRDP